MSNNLYETLWLTKSASQEEIKKSYRKLAMKYHPDKNKGDETAEKKFKEINEAYQVLSDPEKKKQYDMFWSTGGNPFSGAWAGGWNPFSQGFWGSQWAWQGFSGFEDIFSQFWGSSSSSRGWGGVEFDFWDLFGNAWSNPFGWQTGYQEPPKTSEEPKKPVTLDFEKTYQVPIFDMILGCKIEVKWVYGQEAKLKIPAGTKPWAKFRVKDFWKSEWGKKWNLIVKIEALMPKNISDVDKQMLERIRENVGY